jgi:hypothetical protein
MISFLRKIRKQMLKENKVIRYVLYAIGEILLVVIGILIALQVNNNNDLKKLKAKEREQLTYVLENLKSDSLTLTWAINSRTRYLKIHDDLNAFLKGELTADEVINISGVNNILPFGFKTKENNPNLANEVLNSDLKKHIINYYSAIRFSEFNVDKYNEAIETVFWPFLIDHELLNYASKFSKDENREEMDREKFFIELQKPGLQQVLYVARERLGFTGVLKNRAAVENENLKNAILTYLKEND